MSEDSCKDEEFDVHLAYLAWMRDVVLFEDDVYPFRTEAGEQENSVCEE